MAADGLPSIKGVASGYGTGEYAEPELNHWMPMPSANLNCGSTPSPRECDHSPHYVNNQLSRGRPFVDIVRDRKVL
jgi:hypothetical protein